ncbi:MAG: hypothetical protein GY937_23025 [bacterium]|nr:hypothetical protein [bacterium]
MPTADTAINILAQFTIPGEVRSKKNSRQSASGQYVRSSKAHQKWESGAIAYLMQWRGRNRGEDRENAISIYTELWRGTEGHYDPDNMGTSVLDAMVASGIIPRDGFPLVYCTRTRHAGIDRENPRAEVTIYSGDDGPEYGLEITDLGDTERVFQNMDGATARRPFPRVEDALGDQDFADRSG